MNVVRLRSELIGIYLYAIDAVKPERLMKNAIKFQVSQRDSTNTSLVVKRHSGAEDLQIDLKGAKIHVLGGGKSVLSMAKGLAQVVRENQVGDLFAGGVLSLPSESKVPAQSMDDLNLQLFYGSKNNLPDEDSLAASQAILRYIDSCKRDSKPLFIVLLSGGGSACLTYPRHIDLEQKLRLIKELVKKGADIVDLNKVRCYFSYIKAGNLARHIFRNNMKAQVVTLIISDVIGDPVEFIASGPTYIDNTNDRYQQMVEVLRKYQIQVSELPLPEPRFEEPSQCQIYNIIIGNNKIAIEAAAKRAEALDYHVVVMGGELKGSTEEIMRNLVLRGISERNCRRNGKLLVVGGGEATVKLQEGQSWGLGGRAQEMALDYMIERGKIEDCDVDLFLAAGTDGQDGPTDIAGCLASHSEGDIASEVAKNAKENHDSYHFWQRVRPDWMIKTGLTGTNVMDLYMFALEDKH